MLARIIINEGIELYKPNDLNQEPVLILFGDHLLDVLRLLGNPNKEYYSEGNLFLNYFELGFDFMIGAERTLKKIILHTNPVHHPFFGFHSRCYFELDVSRLID